MLYLTLFYTLKNAFSHIYFEIDSAGIIIIYRLGKLTHENLSDTLKTAQLHHERQDQNSWSIVLLFTISRNFIFD